MPHGMKPVTAIGTLLVALLVSLAIGPGVAVAHDNCAPTASAALTSSAIGALPPAPGKACVSKYASVQPKLVRDWAGLQDPEDPFERQSAAASRQNAPESQAPCVNGKAGGFFPCDNVDMLSHVPHAQLGTTFVNDVWGWTDPRTDRDYGLIGASNGTVFVDVTDPKRPQVLGIMPTASSQGGSSWRDIKVYRNHAYVVSEHTNHGVQVFDLTRLRDWKGTYRTFEPDTRYTGHGSAHNININEDTGYAYSVGTGPFHSKGLPHTVAVDSGPAAGEYLANGARFGPRPTQEGLSGDFAIGRSADGSTLGCEPLVDFPAGAIAIVDRGTCAFVTKAQNAEKAGASAVVVANNGPGTLLMGGSADVGIPAVMVSQADGAAIKAGLPVSGRVFANDPPPPCGSGLHVIDIRDPKNPTLAGCFDGHGYVHDTQCVVYEGPDAEFQGREICFNSNGIEYRLGGENYVSIVDVTDKDNPVALSRLPYAGSGYSHQGWLTEDQRFFLHGDEGDEILSGATTATRVWDVSDLRRPFVKQVYTNGETSIDHNLYTQGDLAYASNYTTGLRVYDAGDPGGRGLRELGFFDVYPENDNASFEGGTWSNFPYLRQKGVVVVGSMDRGLFLLQPRVGRSGA